MHLRLAGMDDLTQLKTVYKEIIGKMNREHIQIWDEVYPCAFFEEDIKKGRLYLLTRGRDIIASFALCPSNSGEAHLKWKDPRGKALYLDRFGVNVDCMRQGVGSAALRYAMALAREMDADFLRLLVVDVNLPAIRLYEKNGFCRVGRIYEESFDDVVLREYGYESGLSQSR